MIWGRIPPAAAAASLNRPTLRTLKAILWPWPISPSRASGPTTTPSNSTGRVDVPWMPILCSSAPSDSPSALRSTRKAAMPSSVHLGIDREEVGEARVGDELLGAVEAERAVGQARGAGLDGLRVGARAGLGQAVGRHGGAGGESGEVALLLRVGAEEDRRERADARVGGVGDREVLAGRQGVGDDDRGHVVQAKAAVRLRHVDADVAVAAQDRQQFPVRGVVLGRDALRARRDLAGHERGDRVARGELLGREAFGGEDVGRIGRAEQEGAARRRSLEGRGHAAASTRAGCRPPSHSMIPAAPWPPPTHIVTRP